VEQFLLRPGDMVNPMMRPAGVLIPSGAGQRVLQAGFSQIEAQVMKVGMIAEVTCASKPWTIILSTTTTPTQGSQQLSSAWVASLASVKRTLR
jgi:multidrug resistance efflux pump